ncbi:uncharacterized protein LOC144654713 [Oculina patagonica]
MAFTAYIFQEDFDSLTTREFSHASQLQKGGSLFGLWTGDGNPVVRFAMSNSASEFDRNEMGRDLYDTFKICYIGEWRPVQAHVGNDFSEMISRGEINQRPDAPARFLVLNVSRAAIVPLLFDHQTPKGVGNLERLSGKNPFNKTGLFERLEPTRNYNPPRYPDQSAAARQPTWPQARQAPKRQEAITRQVHWYSGDEGNGKLKKVLEAFKEIALQGKVDMTRDTITQDISLSFTDDRRWRKWEVKFPATFPFGGAVLIESPGTPRCKEHRQGGSRLASTVVNKMVGIIKNRTTIDVSRTDIDPFPFESQFPKGRENFERHPGENLNKRDVFGPTQSKTNYNYPQRYSPQSGDEMHRHDQDSSQSVPQYQKAITTNTQWYSSDEGNTILQKGLEDFNKIARGGHVEMSRDSRNQDISMSFTDIYHQREWEVKFPSSFPFNGAVLIEKPGPRTSSPAEYKQGPSEKASTAVTKMIATIKSRNSLY